MTGDTDLEVELEVAAVAELEEEEEVEATELEADEEALDEETVLEAVFVGQLPKYEHPWILVSMVYESLKVVEHLDVPVGSVDNVEQASRADVT